MADGVTEIEYRAILIFTLVFLDHPRFDGAASRYHLHQQLLVQAYQSSVFFLQETKQGRVFDVSVFYDFGESRDQLATRQRLEHLNVDQDQSRLIKGPNQILPILMIDSSLTPHAGIHLGE